MSNYALNDPNLTQTFDSVNQDILAGVLIFVGLLLAFLGERLWDWLVFGFGFIFSAEGALYILNHHGDDMFKTHLSDDAILWISIAVGVIVGLLLVLLEKHAKGACFVMGGLAGAVLCNFLYGIVAHSTDYHRDWIQITCVVFGVLGGGLIMIWLVHHLLPAVTAFVGGFAIASSIAFYVDQAQNDGRASGGRKGSWLDIAEFFSRPDEMKQCNAECWICFAVWILFFLVGAAYQYGWLCHERKSRHKKTVLYDNGRVQYKATATDDHNLRV